MDRIKRLSYDVLGKYKPQFSEDFANNKKILDQISIIRSKGLKNKIAGYITKFIKKEIREEKVKQAQITSSQFEESVETEAEIPELETASEESVTESIEEPTPKEETTDEKAE